MAKPLSETRIGRNWIRNFRADEYATAKLLLDAVQIVKWSEARPRLQRLVQLSIQSAARQPIWILPVLAEEDIHDILRKKALDEGKKYKRPAKLIPFINFTPGTLISSTPGSEGAIGNMLRKITGGDILPPSTPLDQLRGKKVRIILLVTDFVGSGKQVTDFVRILLTNATLRSWKSFGWVSIRVVTYAISPQALNLIEANVDIERIDYVLIEPTIATASWATKQRTEVTALCVKYAGNLTSPLGFNDHGGLFAFQESIPNTLPIILRRGGKNWSRLFDGRGIPEKLEQELPSVQISDVDYSQRFAFLGQDRMSVAHRRQMRLTNRQILLVLSHLLAENRSIASVQAVLGTDYARTRLLVDYIALNGWISTDLQLTPAGRAELNAGKRRSRRVEKLGIAPKDQPYYPLSLR